MELPFDYVGWEEAQLALQEGKKVTLNLGYGNLHLVYTGEAYGLTFYKSARIHRIPDEKYRSNEWKVWS